MNTLILYDSTFGNTGQIALTLAGRLGDYGTVKLFRIHELGIPHVQDVDLVMVSDQKASLGGSCPAGTCGTYLRWPESRSPVLSTVVVQ